MKAKGNLLTAAEKKLVDELVAHYSENNKMISAMLDQLVTAVQSSDSLMCNVHSLRWRLKEPSHLKEKLERKIKRSKIDGTKFDINKENVFEKINDLAGMRILHLHTGQIVEIDKCLAGVFDTYRYQVIEAAKARTWDDEYRGYYESVGIKTVDSPKMYTSVHYVVSPNMTERFTCEIQVRTLAEELWGEVDHSMNYPHESPVEACRSQIRVLARITSSCSRLVDSIYQSSGQQATKGPRLKDERINKVAKPPRVDKTPKASRAKKPTSAS